MFLSLINKYQMVSAGTLFEKRAAPLKDNRGNAITGVELRAGLRKGARATDHPNSGPKAFIFTDSKFS